VVQGPRLGSGIAQNRACENHYGGETFKKVTGSYQTFDARAFDADLPNEPVEGAISFTNLALVFRGAEIVVQIPLHHLQAEFDDAGDGRIILRDSHRPEWTVLTDDLDVLQVQSVPQLASLAENVTARFTRREVSRRVKLVLGFCAGCGLIFWLGMIATGAMVRSIVSRLPPDIERNLGNGVLEELKGELVFSINTNEVQRLEALARPLLDRLPSSQSWQFYVLEEESPNAFAIPGGHIAVTRGLLDICDRPEQLLGVVAHEVAHVTRKHGFRQQVASAGPILVFQVFCSRGGAMSVLAGGSALLVHQSFSQEYEKEADDTGWNYLVAANIDPRGMTEMFRKLQTYERAEEHARVLPKAFDSHPDMEKRITRLESKWKRLPRKSGFIDLNSEPLPTR
jgi:beta-barrel assembly-enhancing protease